MVRTCGSDSSPTGRSWPLDSLALHDFKAKRVEDQWRRALEVRSSRRCSILPSTSRASAPPGGVEGPFDSRSSCMWGRSTATRSSARRS